MEEIYNYIESENPEAAFEFVKKLEKQISTLESFPTRCPMIPEAQELLLPYRHLLYGKYRTVVRVEGSIVYICRIIHGARLLDLSALE